MKHGFSRIENWLRNSVQCEVQAPFLIAAILHIAGEPIKAEVGCGACHPSTGTLSGSLFLGEKYRIKELVFLSEI